MVGRSLSRNALNNFGLNRDEYPCQPGLAGLLPSREQTFDNADTVRVAERKKVSAVYNPVMSFRSLLLAATIAFTLFPARSQPSIDYHQHLLSPSVAKLLSLPNSFTARDLIPLLDAAGIRQALVLSMAYQYGDPNRPPVPDEYAAVQQENDWTAHQVADFPDRLRAFCGVDPLKSYAVSEVERCARDPYLRS